MPPGFALDRNVPLRARNTFRVDVQAQWFATVQDARALPALLDEPDLRGLPLLVLGDGSNVLFAGRAPSGKQASLEQRRKRIPSSSVLRIELIRGGTKGHDARFFA